MTRRRMIAGSLGVGLAVGISSGYAWLASPVSSLTDRTSRAGAANHAGAKEVSRPVNGAGAAVGRSLRSAGTHVVRPA